MSIKNYEQEENPQQLALFLIGGLSNRNQDIIRRRYGITDNQPKTLEAIGRVYKLTRERIRQIIESSLKIIHRSEKIERVKNFWQKAKSALEKNDGFVAAGELPGLIKEESKADKEYSGAVKFLLILNSDFVLEPEDEKYYSYWHLKKVDKKRIEDNLKKIDGYFQKRKDVSKIEEILDWARKEIRNEAKEKIYSEMNEKILKSYFKISKKIGINPFGEIGLNNWPKIEPTGAKDRAYALLKHSNKPMHFSEISRQLNGFPKVNSYSLILSNSWFKKLETQTIHNELIRDHRFVLVGRGMYALRDWGYAPGKVVDVIRRVFKEAKKALSQEEIIKEVQKRRFAKATTIILNLHNKKYFKKLEDKRYTLIHPYKILES